MRTIFALAVVVTAGLAATSLAARAETPEERAACMDDAFKVCGHAIPDRDRVGACLYQNISRISPACRAAMANYAPGKPLASKRAHTASVPGRLSDQAIR